MEIFTKPGDIIEQFRKRRARQWLISGVMIVAIIVGMWWVRPESDHSPSTSSGQIAPWLYGALILAALVFSLVNWRCPACGKYIGRSISPRFCQKCGAKFAED